MTAINVEFLSKFLLFQDVPMADLEVVRAVAKIREYSPGDKIVTEDEHGTEMFLLLSGEIEITQRLMLSIDHSEDDARNKSLAKMHADQHIAVGETSLFGEGRRTATVRAVNSVTMACLDRSDLLAYCQSNPEFGYRLFYNLGNILSKRLGEANRNIMKISTAFVLALERGR